MKKQFKKKKLIFAFGAAFVAILFLTSAFSSIPDQHSQPAPKSISTSDDLIIGNMTTLNYYEIHDLQKFMTYNLIHYGVHPNNMLDRLQYKADLNFATWYMGNFSQIPSSYRGITPQNSTVILPMWENESSQAQTDVQAVANYEVSQYTTQNEINTTYIVNNRLGNLVSNKTTTHNNQSVNLLVYKYTKDNHTLVYELIDQKGIVTPVDPYIRLNAFTIHLEWGGVISGTSYNIYFTFDDYDNALQFKNSLLNAETISAWVNYGLIILFWSIVTIASGGLGAIVASAVAALVNLYADSSPTSIARRTNNLFYNQEDAIQKFEVTFTLNAWEWGLVPEFSWWGYEYPNHNLSQIFRNVGLTAEGNAESEIENIYHELVSLYGTNQETYVSDPYWFTEANILESM